MGKRYVNKKIPKKDGGPSKGFGSSLTRVLKNFLKKKELSKKTG
ncbi:MAG: hypothetical protein CM15mP12_4120 [Gammaproteobacteria bacterium]|nr:MAG: hypothetical protein CM15mP12_4120 [Gammaproteobacteria bacterium]